MIAGQIGEHRDIEWNSIDAFLRKRMRRNFHHRFRCSQTQGLVKNAVKFERLRCGVRRRNDSVGDMVLNRAHHCCFAAAVPQQ